MMSYSFPNDLRQRIDSQLATGMFNDEDEVLRAAIDMLERRQQGLRQLKQMVRNAEMEIEAGKLCEFDAEKTKIALRQRCNNGVGQ